MIGLMVVMLMVFFTCNELVLGLWGVGPTLRNECGIWDKIAMKSLIIILLL